MPNYFHGHQRLVRRSSVLDDLKLLVKAVARVLRESREVKGHKRLYASSLAFKTVLTLVPALAIIMSVLAGDAFSQKRDQLLDQVVDAIYPVDAAANDTSLDPVERQNLQQLNQAGKQQIRRSVQKFASHAQKAGLLGLIGFALVVFLLLRDVEGSFNFLWGLKKGRPLTSQVVRHTLFLIGAPLLACVILTLKGWVKAVGFSRPLMDGWFFAVLLPFLSLWAVCSWMYLWIPNTKVDRRSALWAGLLVALLLEAAQNGMNWYTLHMMASFRIYGALWVIPIILIWFYLSWTIVLFGAEAAYFMHQSREEVKR